MNVLLDTHTLIWAVDDPTQLGATASSTLQNSANQLLLSAATVWEISIKVGIGKLTLSAPFRDWMNKAIADLGLSLVPVTVEYADTQSRIPWHHRDPFDRLLVAQSLTDGTPVVSADAILDPYGVSRLW